MTGKDFYNGQSKRIKKNLYKEYKKDTQQGRKWSATGNLLAFLLLLLYGFIVINNYVCMILPEVKEVTPLLLSFSAIILAIYNLAFSIVFYNWIEHTKL